MPTPADGSGERNGRRRYSGAEIERLQLLARLTDGGQLISELAGLETAELLELARDEDDRAARPAGKKPNRARTSARASGPLSIWMAARSGTSWIARSSRSIRWSRSTRCSLR